MTPIPITHGNDPGFQLRDRERTLWLLLAALVPYVGWLWLLVECGFLPAPGGGKSHRRLVRRTVTAGIENREPE